MNTKYEFVPGDEKVIAPGRTVKRIRINTLGSIENPQSAPSLWIVPFGLSNSSIAHLRKTLAHLEYRLLIEVAHSRIARARAKL